MRLLKPVPVGAELEMDRERGECVHAAERAQSRDGRPPLPVGRELADPLGERLLAGGQPVHARDQVGVGQLADIGSRNCWAASHRRCSWVQVDGLGYTRP